MGDGQRTWRIWFDRHGPALVLYARQLVREQALAEDAVQEGFVRFWRMRHKPADPTAIMYAAVRSAALDLTRSDARRRRRELGTMQSEIAAFEAPAEQRERAVQIERALAELPEPQREVVVMKIWGGLTFAQIAEAIGEGANTVASRYRYAMEKLAAVMAQEVRDER